MPHLTEKVAEFIFGELSAQEMAEAQRHLTQCSDCREQVEQFQTTYAMLKTSPDVEPPRRILFEFEKPRASAWIWRWLAPMAASAAVAALVVTFTPRPQQPPQIIERVVQQQAAAPQAQPVEYQKIIDDLREEIKQRDAAQARQLQEVRHDVALLDNDQRAVQRGTWENSRSIQLLASKIEPNKGE
jgi:anti-sigma-K factor RskA